MTHRTASSFPIDRLHQTCNRCCRSQHHETATRASTQLSGHAPAREPTCRQMRQEARPSARRGLRWAASRWAAARWRAGCCCRCWQQRAARAAYAPPGARAAAALQPAAAAARAGSRGAGRGPERFQPGGARATPCMSANGCRGGGASNWLASATRGGGAGTLERAGASAGEGAALSSPGGPGSSDAARGGDCEPCTFVLCQSSPRSVPIDTSPGARSLPARTPSRGAVRASSSVRGACCAIGCSAGAAHCTGSPARPGAKVCARLARACERIAPWQGAPAYRRGYGGREGRPHSTQRRCEACCSGMMAHSLFAAETRDAVVACGYEHAAAVCAPVASAAAGLM